MRDCRAYDMSDCVSNKGLYQISTKIKIKLKKLKNNNNKIK